MVSDPDPPDVALQPQRVDVSSRAAESSAM
jgi:hypothetical protein